MPRAFSVPAWKNIRLGALRVSTAETTTRRGRREASGKDGDAIPRLGLSTGVDRALHLLTGRAVQEHRVPVVIQERSHLHRDGQLRMGRHDAAKANSFPSSSRTFQPARSMGAFVGFVMPTCSWLSSCPTGLGTTALRKSPAGSAGWTRLARTKSANTGRWSEARVLLLP